MSVLNLLYKRELPITTKISVRIPTIGEILEDEGAYYTAVTMLTSMPIDMMVELDRIGVDYTTITEYELFLAMFSALKNTDTSLLFGNLDLTKFEASTRMDDGCSVLIDRENDIEIDKFVASKIATALRTIHHFEKTRRKPANQEAKEYMLERAKLKAKRRKGKKQQSQLEPLIVALVNTEQFRYGYEGVRNLTIYQFNESVHQVIKKIDYDNKIRGVYAGTISAKDLSQDDLNWLSHK